MSSKHRIAIVCSKYNEKIVEGLLNGAKKRLTEENLSISEKDIYLVPGAWEIGVMTKKLCNSKKYNGIIALGCLIKGDTAHFEYIAEPLVHALMDLSVKYTIPVGMGVLTCYTAKQAYERSLDNKENKGYETALAVLEMLKLLK
ncbi:6,7-dimethyl-8-ribityllumazine synthase [soil metagenome]